MKIIKFVAENIKRIRAVTVPLKNNGVSKIGGCNGEGKSSAIDALFWALAGKSVQAEVPVRKGEEAGTVEVDIDGREEQIGDVILRLRVNTKGGRQLTLRAKDGKDLGPPQAMLDRLIGPIAFDPLQFSRQPPKEQSDTLRRLAGLDFAEIDRKAATASADRTEAGREVKSLQSQLAALPKPPEAAVPCKSVAEVLKEQREAAALNARNAQIRREAEAASLKHSLVKKKMEEQIAALKHYLNQAAHEVEIAAKVENASLTQLRVCGDDVDLSRFDEELRLAQCWEREMEVAKRRSDLASKLEHAEQRHGDLDSEIERCASDKRRMIREAKYPLDGLSVSDTNEVLYNGVPLAQASSAEALLVGTHIAFALNPNLRLCLIRDGSLLDERSEQMLQQASQKHDFQILMEVARKDDDCQVIIEDGLAAPSTPKPV